MFTLQGQNQGSHTGPSSKFAYDFSPGPFDPRPFQVRAARAGRIAQVVKQWPPSPDCDPSFNDKTNYVIVDHGDGTGAMYLHLAQEGVLVPQGVAVGQGEAIAITGHSGFICGTAHLHFTLIDLQTRESIDVPFIDPDTIRSLGRPQTGQSYISANVLQTNRVLLPYVTRR